ncbi:hypothetical protein W97_01969 [Coniosporium apollinis CBS 100218]|uniref:37S ribosomal protein S25, mitochondrial n=1 Tax=Coniosporium apollinis (strain CBS 100218) TaxID=1168221 RepID=R7YLQ6_CONA1|nr:uncharacterized protein W97_01969 [Coniosporium apollinis CBS 100218]EON62744.1 hypothetical protein W97_01969 [Coniosporium apollinis CBS 100218]
MGRYDFRPLRVHSAATQLLETQRLRAEPPWYHVVANIPPSQPLVRPILNAAAQSKKGKKPSRMFQPMPIKYPEDQLRREFFSDHPWELARPRVVLEDDGKDGKRWEWSRIEQEGRALDGESVVQRQLYLMKRGGPEGQPMSKEAAYDKARKEFYAHRHQDEVERRVAREEALHVGAYFGKSALEIGMELEDKSYEDWKVWATKEAMAVQIQSQGGSLTTVDDEDAALDSEDPETVAALDEVEKSVPNNKKGQDAKGGAALHP